MNNLPAWIFVGAIGAAVMILPDLMKVRNASKVIRATDTVPSDGIKPLVKGYEAYGVVKNTNSFKTIQERQQKDKSAVTHHGHLINLENP